MPRSLIPPPTDRELTLFDTPGHTRHHISIRDTRSGHIFVGDTFGLAYRELDRAVGATRLEKLKAGVAAIMLEESVRQDWALQGDALLQFMKMDIELNAQGLSVWPDQQS